MRIRKKDIVPSVFTMLNLFFGFFAIVNALRENFVAASWFIIIAAIWDVVDGRIARLTHTYSEFGLEFDSLADVVSFGVAPSILIYQIFFYKLGPFGIILSFFPLLFGAIRLARFNVNSDGFEKENFTGLPIPATAVTLSSYVIFNYDLWEGLKFGPLLIPMVLLLSVLMVSNVEYETMPKFSFRVNRRNTIQFLLVMLGVAIIVVFREKVMFPLVFGFVLYYLFRAILHSLREEEEEDEVFDISISD
ncbi:MAG TPA: CDP-diacylglycerol--serine O-phosphatidyltransferase [bacterium]